MSFAESEHSEARKKRRSFVLVHGGFHGGWCYVRVAERLRALGHRVFTPTLTGLGERSHLATPAINCSLHVRDVLNVLKWERLSDVVLCGHSYGGMVIAGVADAVPDSIASLVFLGATLPEDGKSALDVIDEADRRALLTMVAAQGGQFLSPFPAELLNVNGPDREWVNALCTSQPFATLTERMVLNGACPGRSTCVPPIGAGRCRSGAICGSRMRRDGPLSRSTAGTI